MSESTSSDKTADELLAPDLDSPASEQAELPESAELSEEAVPAGQTQAVGRNSAIMAVGTITSRITGVARDIAITAALGSAILADTYALGNSLPNIVYILIIGGALNAVFIPQLVRHMKHDADGGDGYADRLITLVTLILVVAGVLAVIFAPIIVAIYTTSDFSDSQVELATAFARYCLPQVIFYGLYTMFAQVLNSRLHFAAPMFAPIINNIVMIATALAFIVIVGTSASDSTITSTQVAWLGIGTTLGVVAQAAVLVPVLLKVGYRWRPRFDFRGHGLGKAGKLAGWTIGLVLINQVGFLVISRLATHANFIAEQTGDVPQGLATYQRALLVFMLPHAVITVSLVTALFPRMSRAAADGDLGEVAADVASGMRLISSLMVPCIAIMAVFGPLIGTVIFGFGQNSGAPAVYTGWVVSVFALAVLPFAFFYTLLRGWYAVEDTKTPFWITVIYNVIAIPLTYGLFEVMPDEFGVIALALGYALAYWIVLAIAWTWLRRRLGRLPTLSTFVAVLRMLAAGLVAVVVALGVLAAYFYATGTRSATTAFDQATSSQLAALITLGVGAVVLLVVYIGMARVFRITEVGELVGSVLRKVTRS